MKLLNAEPGRFAPAAVALLRGNFDYTELEIGVSLVDAVVDTEILITKLGHLVDRTVIDAAPRLRVIATPTTGLNHLDVEYAESRDIAVLSLKGDYDFLKGVTATAEHTWALLLALARKIPAAVDHVRGGKWERNSFIGVELSGKTLGIVGLGRLGSMVAKYGSVFGMDVVACDAEPSCGNPDDVPLVSLGVLLSKSDFVSIHVDLNENSVRLIGRDELSLMKPGAFLINTSRGEVIDESALLEALDAGRIAGAAVDVLAGEYTNGKGWITVDPLITYSCEHENLLITPHIGGATADSMRKADVRIAERLVDLFRYETYLDNALKRCDPGQ